jgi:hypothetical protein
MQPKILSIEEEILEEYRPPLTRKRKKEFPGKNTRSATLSVDRFGVEQCGKNGGARERPSVVFSA